MKYILVFIISFNCFADDWRTEDTQREIIYLTVDAIDWAQTRNIARNPDSLHEINPILGAHPNVDKVDLYFVIMAFAHYAASTLISVEYRSTFQYSTIAIESFVVGRNLQLGIDIKF